MLYIRMAARCNVNVTAGVTQTIFSEVVDLHHSQERDTWRDIYFKKPFCYGIRKILHFLFRSIAEWCVW